MQEWTVLGRLVTREFSIGIVAYNLLHFHSRGQIVAVAGIGSAMTFLNLYSLLYNIDTF